MCRRRGFLGAELGLLIGYHLLAIIYWVPWLDLEPSPGSRHPRLTRPRFLIRYWLVAPLVPTPPTNSPRVRPWLLFPLVA